MVKERPQKVVKEPTIGTVAQDGSNFGSIMTGPDAVKGLDRTTSIHNHQDAMKEFLNDANMLEPIAEHVKVNLKQKLAKQDRAAGGSKSVLE